MTAAPHQHAHMHAGRKLTNIAQAARGREPSKWELEVIPFFAGELPSGLGRVCFTWERGSKVFCTSAEPVNPATRAVFWSQFLKQTATMYREAGRLLPKEYSFKIQHMRGGGGGGDSMAAAAAAAADGGTKKTIGKIKLDMAQFCSAETASMPQEVFLQLKPAGKLKVSIKATWLQDAAINEDALTDLSFGTHRSTEGGGEAPGALDEQDLSGFDEVPAQAHQRQRSSAGASSSPRHRDGGGGGIAAYRQGAGSPEPSPGRGAGGGVESPRSTKAGSLTGSKLKPPSLAPVPGAIAPFSVGLSPQAEAERAAWLAEERARQAAFHAAESHKLRRTIEDQLRVELNDVLVQHRSFSWRRLFCCCCPGAHPARLRTTQELAALQRDTGDAALLDASPLPL